MCRVSMEAKLDRQTLSSDGPIGASAEGNPCQHLPPLPPVTLSPLFAVSFGQVS